MAERGIGVDHSTIHPWAVYFSPVLLKRFNRRKRAVTGKWHVDESRFAFNPDPSLTEQFETIAA